jgi:hypothetical protein
MPELADLDVIHSARGYQPMPVSNHNAPWWPGCADAPAPVYPGLVWDWAQVGPRRTAGFLLFVARGRIRRDGRADRRMRLFQQDALRDRLPLAGRFVRCVP